MSDQKQIQRTDDVAVDEIKPKLKKPKLYRVILLNDDYNTIDHVIDCLEAICDHSSLQAEQCAVITHYQGQCAIKKGLIEELEFFRQDLSLYGLNVEIL